MEREGAEEGGRKAKQKAEEKLLGLPSGCIYVAFLFFSEGERERERESEKE